MRAHRRFPIDDVSQVGEARRAAQALAAELGFEEEAAGRLALAVTELGTNLARHVGTGRQAALLIGVAGSRGSSASDSNQAGSDTATAASETSAASATSAIDVLSLDQGGGMDLDRCLRDGFSTGGTAGTGLGAIRRMAERFGGFSLPGRGTVLATRFGPRVERHPKYRSAPPFDVAGLSLAAPGETVSGDAWTVRRDGAQWTIGVADGLGHGPSAAEAADRYTALLAQSSAGALASPAAFLERTHEPLRSTRGCAAAAVALSDSATQLQFAGAGNIAGRLISGVVDRSLLSQHGTLGLQIRRIQNVVYDWPPHAVLVLHSDGIVSRWSLEDTPGLLRADPAVIAGWILRDHLRGKDDATVVVVRRAEGQAKPESTEGETGT